MPAVTRICILSDTHGTLDPRVAAAAADCDIALHGGDIGNAAVLEQLKTRGSQVIAVTGNNDTPDKWPPHDGAVLATLPDKAQLDLPGGRVVVEHGHGVNPAKHRHQKLRSRYPDARAIVYGHSHRLTCDLDLPWVLNPGAAGRSRTYGGPSCLILSVGQRRWRVAALRFSAVP